MRSERPGRLRVRYQTVRLASTASTALSHGSFCGDAATHDGKLGRALNQSTAGAKGRAAAVGRTSGCCKAAPTAAVRGDVASPAGDGAIATGAAADIGAEELFDGTAASALGVTTGAAKAVEEPIVKFALSGRSFA